MRTKLEGSRVNTKEGDSRIKKHKLNIERKVNTEGKKAQNNLK